MTFNKRCFTLTTFVASGRDLFAHLDDLLNAATQRRVSRAFAERIMLAVTRVNGCRYCSYAHTRMALRAGIDEAELKHLMDGDLESAPADERVALLFAQHYAEQREQIDPLAWQRLVEVYSPDVARDILAHIRMITVANLLGNTFDAWLSRCRGRPAPGNRLVDELGVLFLTTIMAPVSVLIIVLHYVATAFRLRRTQPVR